MIIRDVMNTKSHTICRHAVDATNYRYLSNYYSIESRVNNCLGFEECLNEITGEIYKLPIKSEYYFTNEMVFDFDFKEGELPDDILKEKLEGSLEKLYSILGKPQFVIRNKDSYTRYQIEKYFTNTDKYGNSVINMPKKYGCQVIYELDESLSSIYIERVKLYHDVRLKLSKECDSDILFKGHMHKNQYNGKLFDVVFNKDDNKLYLKDLAKTMGYDVEYLEKVYETAPYSKMIVKTDRMSSYIDLLRSENFNYYKRLNTYKGVGVSKTPNTAVVASVEKCKSESRNISIFNYLLLCKNERIKNVTIEELKSLGLFSNCTIKDTIENIEFESIKKSILSYREENNFDWESSIRSEINVFDIKFEDFDPNFIEKFINIRNKNIKYKNITGSENEKVSFVAKMLWGSIRNSEFEDSIIMKNVESLFSESFIDFIKMELGFSIETPIFEVVNIVKGAVCMIHWKAYHSRKKYYKREHKNQNLLDLYGVSEIVNDNECFLTKLSNFSKYFNILLSDGLIIIDEDGKYKSNVISFYREYFGINNLIASIFTQTVKAYIKFLLLKEHIINYLKLIKELKSNIITKSCYIIFKKCTSIIKYIINIHLEDIINGDYLNRLLFTKCIEYG